MISIQLLFAMMVSVQKSLETPYRAQGSLAKAHPSPSVLYKVIIPWEARRWSVYLLDAPSPVLTCWMLTYTCVISSPRRCLFCFFLHSLQHPRSLGPQEIRPRRFHSSQFHVHLYPQSQGSHVPISIPLLRMCMMWISRSLTDSRGINSLCHTQRLNMILIPLEMSDA